MLPPYMGHQERQRRRSDAIETAGLADGPRPMGLQLLADFVRKPGQSRIIEVIGKDQALIAPIGFHIGRLTAQIDVVFCVGLELFGDLGLEFREFRPDPRQIGDTAKSG